ncbi:unnamed protein product [Psylliodes chrysocephalus]|uniref:Uncharacterized protein n=1 Tax=Psylliodes chrysocephalus TaxID=3402493 RepID=A0A9P0CXL9_9CUCU|nr:unnamed protein product [Psylliodes chrysocephala]
MNTINIEFQSVNPRLHQLLPRVTSVYEQILKNYLQQEYVLKNKPDEINLNNPRNFQPIENIYFGVRVDELINESQIDSDDLHNFRKNCLNFYIELARQIKARFPFDNPLYLQLTWLDPKNIFSIKKAKSIIPLVRKFPNMVEQLLEMYCACTGEAPYEAQYKLIKEHFWAYFIYYKSPEIPTPWTENSDIEEENEPAAAAVVGPSAQVLNSNNTAVTGLQYATLPGAIDHGADEPGGQTEDSGIQSLSYSPVLMNI